MKLLINRYVRQKPKRKRLRGLFLLLLSFCLFAVYSYSRELSCPIENGNVYVGGKSYSKQVFVKQNDSVFQLSNFSHWENIRSIYVSPKQKYVVVYHRADKERFHRLTLYDIEKKLKLADTAPGMQCNDIMWFKDLILFVTGTSGGTIVTAYNYDLITQYEICDLQTHINLEEAICFSYPIWSAQNGVFARYDLDNGAKLEEFDYLARVQVNYICRSVAYKGNRTYQFELETFDPEDIITVSRTF